MSLTFDCKDNTVHLANLYSKGKLKDKVCYNDPDNLPEDEKNLTKIRLNEEGDEFFPAINDFKKTEQTQRFYVCGETGVGKSTFIKKYIMEFKKKYPRARVLLFSSKMEDKTLDELGYIERVQIDDDILTNPYTLAEIAANSKPCLTVFDDVEDFQNKKITREIERLLNEVLRNGRSYGIYSIFTHHQPADYVKTRNLIFEASHCVLFPRRSGKETYNYFLEKKMNLNKKTIDMINNLKSNFVCIKKNIPKTVIADKYILLV